MQGFKNEGLTDDDVKGGGISTHTGHDYRRLSGGGKNNAAQSNLGGRSRPAVSRVVNDFGQVNIDTQLLDSAGADQIIDLPNGCICCTLARDLAGVVTGVVELEDPPEQLIVEASGVSSPADVESILDVPELASRVRVNSIITLVDAENALRLARAVMFADKQIAAADIVVVNKTDLVNADQLAAVLDWIIDIAPDARIVKTEYANIPIDLITGATPRATKQSPIENQKSEIYNLFRSWTFTTNTALSKAGVLAVVKNLPASIYRAKGLLYFGHDPGRQYVLHVVGRRVTLQADRPWGEHEPRSQIVFIGESDGFDPAGLEASLGSCIV